MVASPATVLAADVLTAARLQVAVVDAVTCRVTGSFGITLDRARDVEQRLQRHDGARIDGVEVTGVAEAAAPRTFGVTEVFSLRFPAAGPHRYDVRYRATQPEAWAYRCPIWLPVVAADGHSRSVEIEVTLPEGATPAGWSFPAFRWEGRVGRATIGNVPAFIRAPYEAPGETRSHGANLGRVMDAVAAAFLLGGTALWLIRRRR